MVLGSGVVGVEKGEPEQEPEQEPEPEPGPESDTDPDSNPDSNPDPDPDPDANHSASNSLQLKRAKLLVDNLPDDLVRGHVGYWMCVCVSGRKGSKATWEVEGGRVKSQEPKRDGRRVDASRRFETNG